jgi:hypothetical protein
MKKDILALYDTFLGRFKSFRLFIKVYLDFLERQDFLEQENKRNQETIIALKEEIDSIIKVQPPNDSSKDIVRHGHDILDVQRKEYYAQ